MLFYRASTTSGRLYSHRTSWSVCDFSFTPYMYVSHLTVCMALSSLHGIQRGCTFLLLHHGMNDFIPEKISDFIFCQFSHNLIKLFSIFSKCLSACYLLLLHILGKVISIWYSVCTCPICTYSTCVGVSLFSNLQNHFSKHIFLLIK